jgi:hypothetical protein
MLAGTVMSAGGSIMQGKAAQASSEFQAGQLDRNALAAEASSQRVAIEDRRKAEVLQSRARAVAAAGGGVTTDVGVSDVLAKIEEAGEYNALASLFEGREQAAGLRTKAAATRFEGKAAKKAGQIQALSTIMSGGAKTAERQYG